MFDPIQERKRIQEKYRKQTEEAIAKAIADAKARYVAPIKEEKDFLDAEICGHDRYLESLGVIDTITYVEKQ